MPRARRPGRKGPGPATDLAVGRHLCVKLAKPPRGNPGGAQPGAIAQLVERLHGMQEVRSSILLSSTKARGEVCHCPSGWPPRFRCFCAGLRPRLAGASPPAPPLLPSPAGLFSLALPSRLLPGCRFAGLFAGLPALCLSSLWVCWACCGAPGFSGAGASVVVLVAGGLRECGVRCGGKGERGLRGGGRKCCGTLSACVLYAFCLASRVDHAGPARTGIGAAPPPVRGVFSFCGRWAETTDGA